MLFRAPNNDARPEPDRSEQPRITVNVRQVKPNEQHSSSESLDSSTQVYDHPPTATDDTTGVETESVSTVIYTPTQCISTQSPPTLAHQSLQHVSEQPAQETLPSDAPTPTPAAEEEAPLEMHVEKRETLNLRSMSVARKALLEATG